LQTAYTIYKTKKQVGDALVKEVQSRPSINAPSCQQEQALVPFHL